VQDVYRTARSPGSATHFTQHLPIPTAMFHSESVPPHLSTADRPIQRRRYSFPGPSGNSRDRPCHCEHELGDLRDLRSLIRSLENPDDGDSDCDEASDPNPDFYEFEDVIDGLDEL
jgi:hypothetical protein